MPYPDDLNPALFSDHVGDSPHALAYENELEREWDDLIFRILDGHKPEGKQLTNGQDFISDLVIEEELDGTLYAAIQAAAKHLKSAKSISKEQVGQILIDALEKDLTAIAERRAGDAE